MHRCLAAASVRTGCFLAAGVLPLASLPSRLLGPPLVLIVDQPCWWLLWDATVPAWTARWQRVSR